MTTKKLVPTTPYERACALRDRLLEASETIMDELEEGLILARSPEARPLEPSPHGQWHELIHAYNAMVRGVDVLLDVVHDDTYQAALEETFGEVPEAEE